MSAPARIAVWVLVGACLIVPALRQARAGEAPGAAAAAADGGASYRLDDASARRAGVAVLDERTRAATVRFASASAPADEQFFHAAIAAARPEAQRLIAAVDGLVTVAFGAVDGPRGAIGLTRFDGREYRVTVDLGRILAGHGPRDAAATILHELGHVVDRAIVSDELAAELDAGIPRGYSCEPGRPTGACAPIEERFADTFAKWAMDDLGVNGTVGYRILPPVPIADWGLPLVRLAQAA